MSWAPLQSGPPRPGPSLRGPACGLPMSMLLLMIASVLVPAWGEYQYPANFCIAGADGSLPCGFGSEASYIVVPPDATAAPRGIADTFMPYLQGAIYCGDDEGIRQQLREVQLQTMFVRPGGSGSHTLKVTRDHESCGEPDCGNGNFIDRATMDCVACPYPSRCTVGLHPCDSLGMTTSTSPAGVSSVMTSCSNSGFYVTECAEGSGGPQCASCTNPELLHMWKGAATLGFTVMVGTPDGSESAGQLDDDWIDAQPAYTQLSDACTECPSSTLGETMLALLACAALGGFGKLLWVISKVHAHDDGSASADGQDAVEGVTEGRSGAKAVSDAAYRINDAGIFASITLMFAQIALLSFQLPFRLPEILPDLSGWIAGFFAVDFSQMASAECRFGDQLPVVIHLWKFIAGNVAVLTTAGLVFLAGVRLKQRDHAFNAATALFTVSVGSLVKSCIERLKCTKHEEVSENNMLGSVTYGGETTLDVRPEIVCWSACDAPAQMPGENPSNPGSTDRSNGLPISYADLHGLSQEERDRMEQAATSIGHRNQICDDDPELGSANSFGIMAIAAGAGLFIYIVLIPLLLFKGIRRAAYAGSLSDPSTQQRYGWMTLKYKPSCWFFEFAFLLYKLAWVTSAAILSAEGIAGAWLLLIAHVAITCGLLVLVALFRPFATGKATQLQLVCLAAQLGIYAVGAGCLSVAEDQDNCETKAGLKAAALVAEMILCFVVLCVAVVNLRSTAAEVSGQDDGAVTISSQNPLHAEDGEDDDEDALE
jgi:hypothetical protein